MYDKILLALDGSSYSDMALDAGILLSRNNSTTLVGCHVYSSQMHAIRFVEMEPGLPERYQEEERIKSLRNTHTDLIDTGMQLISDAYISPMIKMAQEHGVTFQGSTPEGRNYVQLLRLICEIKPDLVILGGYGHGKECNNTLGSLTQRILLHGTDSDLLIVKEPINFKYRPIIVGIDGSENSYNALTRAIKLSKIVGAEIKTIAAYDPYFHSGVFRTISDALPEKDKERFNFVAQEKLHDEIIDKGLEKLYFEGLKRGELLAESMKSKVTMEVLMGKVYTKILNYADLKNAGLIVLGRWGLHQEQVSLIGSNTFNIAMACNMNILIVSKSNGQIEIPNLPKVEKLPLKWTSEAQDLIKNVPVFARKMAIAAIEDYAREKGFSEVIPEVVEEVANNMGMGAKMAPLKSTEEEKHDKPKETNENNIPEAQKIVLKKIKKLAPNFHKNIVGSKIVGEIVEKGEIKLVYEIIEVYPSSPAKVTEKTALEFK